MANPKRLFFNEPSLPTTPGTNELFIIMDVKEDVPVKSDTPGFLDVDMNKLNKALQGGFKIV